MSIPPDTCSNSSLGIILNATTTNLTPPLKGGNKIQRRSTMQLDILFTFLHNAFHIPPRICDVFSRSAFKQ